MGINYQIVYLEPVVRKHIPALPSRTRALIRKAIEECLTVDPLSFGKPLRYSLKGHRRLRVGDYRIDPEAFSVVVVAIQHRKDIYKN